LNQPQSDATGSAGGGVLLVPLLSALGGFYFITVRQA